MSSFTLLLLSLVAACWLLCVARAQPTPPSYGPAPLPFGQPVNPAQPAANGYFQPSSSASTSLDQFDTFIELWFAGNSYDYLFGSFEGGRGIDEYLAGVKAGKYTQQRYPSNAPTSFKVNTVYPQLPYDFQGCVNPDLSYPCPLNYSILRTYEISQNLNSLPLTPIEMSQIISLKNDLYYFVRAALSSSAAA